MGSRYRDGRNKRYNSTKSLQPSMRRLSKTKKCRERRKLRREAALHLQQEEKSMMRREIEQANREHENSGQGIAKTEIIAKEDEEITYVDRNYVIVNPIGNQDLLDDPPRKRRRRFSFEEKKNILEAMNQYPPNVICEKYKLNDRTLRKWKLERGKIFQEANKTNSQKLKMKANVETKVMDDAVFQRLVETQDQGIPISGPIIKRQALIVKVNHPKNDQFKKCSADITPDVVVNPIGNQDLLDGSPRKRRRRFSFEEKKNILEAMNQYPINVICEKYELNDRTLRKWKSNKEKIIEEAKKTNSKRLKKMSNVEEMDDAVFEWLVETQDQGIPISGPMIKRQALIVKENHPKNNQFKASNGWLSGFKKRKQIESLKITACSSDSVLPPKPSIVWIKEEYEIPDD